MRLLIDREFVDPDWPVGDEFDIFNVCEFSKLTDKEVFKFLLSKQVINQKVQSNCHIIRKEFSVAYDYTYRAWIEERSIDAKYKPAGSSASTTSTTSETGCTSNKPWDPQHLVKQPSETFSEHCKTKILSSTTSDCDKCQGKGRDGCTTCRTTGFVQCPQCRGVGFGGKRVMAMSTSMSVNRTSQGVTVCARCRGNKTVPCAKCGGSFSKGNCCKACKGRGKVCKEKQLKTKWYVYQDRIACGRHTSKIPEALIFNAYGVDLHNEEQPLNEDLCPDRRDLVQVSNENPVRIGINCAGKIRKQCHQLRALPVCTIGMAIGQPDGTKSLYTFYIIGSIDCKLHTVRSSVALDANRLFTLSKVRSDPIVERREIKTKGLWNKAISGLGRQKSAPQ